MSVSCRWSCLLLLLLVLPGWAGAASLHVPRDVPTIQEAVDHASAGDIIYVHGGLYPESVVIDRPLELVGIATQRDNETTLPPAMSIETGRSILDPTESRSPTYAVIAPESGPAIRIRSDDVRIVDMVTLSPAECIQVQNASRVTIQGTLLAECGTGIRGSGVDGLSVSGNRFQQVGLAGIDLRYSSGAMVRDNQFTGGLVGIRAENARRWSIVSNRFEDLSTGISGTGLSDSRISGNTLTNLNSGYVLLASQNAVIEGDEFQRLHQYILLVQSLSTQVRVKEGNNATILSQERGSQNSVYQTGWFTLIGENMALSLRPGYKITGYQQFGEEVEVDLNTSSTGPSWATLESVASIETWNDVDPFTFGFYPLEGRNGVMTGTTYVSGSTMRTRSTIRGEDEGLYVLMAKRKNPFGLVIEGITVAVLIIAASIALFLFRRTRSPP